MDALFQVDEHAANQQLLVAAREALGLTQTQLAARLSELVGANPKISQGYVSRVEKGALTVSGDRLALFATALECTPDLLVEDTKVWSLGEGCVYHRNRASTKASTLRRLHARINLLRLHLHRLAVAAGQPLPEFTWTPRRVGGMDGADDVARAVRSELGLGRGAIESVTAIAERMGALVVPMSLGGREVDATSLHPPGEAPLFVINTDAPTDRRRFTLGHELGHVACLPDPDEDVEEMAQQFAAELLAPSAELRDDLRAVPITPARLLQLKAVWRISAAALLRRAVDLAVISESRYRSINAQISALGWRTGEPEPLPAEQAVMVPTLVQAAVKAVGGVDAAAAVAGTTTDNLRELFGNDVIPHI
ncbi:Zn-dependent peptidase ImmA, M78 family [Actinomadura glauciflava]|uniref:helix-turn-helix domain-containing protein n=1 Tax=Actinomadura luteofluorescens TaxID=46163 RepID=UPI00216419C5|nr:XRE family transcriptional regulator [Actinomadura glauciflava]MCR3738400.1 Zn-dependent peptidase ImmA, M78 family [Actinomadura glauciflava]